MKNLVGAMAVAAAVLIGGSAAHAAGTGQAGEGARASQSTDISARSRHHHSRHHYSHGHHWRHGYYRPRPYYNSYGYYRRPGYGYYGRPYGYYGGGPGVTFSFGTGRW